MKKKTWVITEQSSMFGDPEVKSTYTREKDVKLTNESLWERMPEDTKQRKREVATEAVEACKSAGFLAPKSIDMIAMSMDADDLRIITEVFLHSKNSRMKVKAARSLQNLRMLITNY